MATNVAPLSVSHLLESLSIHLKQLKERNGSECDASTVLHLLQQCGALQSAMQLLLQSLNPTLRIQARLSSLLQRLSDTTRDLHRDGGIAVRSNAEVWSDLLSLSEAIVDSVSEAVNDWMRRQQDVLHVSLGRVQGTLRQLRDAAAGHFPGWDARILQEIFLSVVNCTCISMKLLSWYYVCASNNQVQNLQAWLMQLDMALHLLPMAVATFSPSAIENQTNYLVCLNVVINRVLSVVDELINITTIESVVACNNVDFQSSTQHPMYQPGAFVSAVDKVLGLLTQDEKGNLSSSFCVSNVLDHSETYSARDDVDLSSTKARSIALDTENSVNYSSKPNGKVSSYTYQENAQVTSESEVSDNSEQSAITNLTKLVKGPLEDILRHVIAIAYCSSQADNKTIMVLCENVLSSLKRLSTAESGHTSITIASSSPVSPDLVDVCIAREVLLESVERLEQAANTALIRSVVTTFAVVDAPLNALLGAVSQSGQGDDHSTGGDGSLGVVEGLIADLDLHVDAIFQVTAFAIACSADDSRVSELRSCLLSLEWLECVLVPSIQTLQAHMAQRSPLSTEGVNQVHNRTHNVERVEPSRSVDVKNRLCSNSSSIAAAKNHVKLLARHWKATVTALQNCLDKILDPAAFVMVTQREVHTCWWSVKQQLYTQDMRWLRGRVTALVGMVERVGQLNNVEPFVDQSQEQQLTAAVSKVRRGLSAVEHDPANLRLHRALLKRVQLLLTVVTRLSASLNDTSIRDTSHLQLGGHGMKRNEEKALNPRLPSAAAAPACVSNNFFLTSDIAVIPVDVATPFLTTAARRHERPLLTPSSNDYTKTQDEDASYFFQEIPREVLGKGDDGTGCEGVSCSKEPYTNLTVLSSYSKSDGIRLSSYMRLKSGRDERGSFSVRSLSVSKLGTTRLKAAGSGTTESLLDPTPASDESSQCPTPHQRSPSDGACDDTSLDITKFLTLSFSPCRAQSVRSSIRASLRSALIKSRAGSLRDHLTAKEEANELNVDLNCFIGPAVTAAPQLCWKNSRPFALPPKVPKPASLAAKVKAHEERSFPCETTSISEQDPALSDCQNSGSESNVLFEGKDGLYIEASAPEVQPLEENSNSSTTQGSHDVKTLTGILENLSSLATSFSTLADPSTWDTTAIAQEGTKNLLLHSEDGIKSGNSSTGDHEVESSLEQTTLSRDVEKRSAASSSHLFLESPFKTHTEKRLRVSVSDGDKKENFNSIDQSREHKAIESFSSDCSEFASILGERTTTPISVANSSLLMNTDTVLSIRKRLPLNEKTNVSSSSSSDHMLQKSVTDDIQPSLQASGASDYGCTGIFYDLTHAGSVKSVMATQSESTCRSTPESVSVSTPQRLLDLHVLRKRLSNLRSMFKLK